MSHKKQIFKVNTLKKLLDDENSCVSLVPTTRLLALPPFFLNDMKSGILYLLNNMLKKYDRSLGGIVIGYQNIKVLMDENTGIIPMGTSETEVNISVEFYIFQPKIGSFLEGVVNKKSNSHIGCLVHRYFNATILKPEDIDYDEWICQDLNVDDRIIFKVKDLDFTSLLPLIEGAIDDERFLGKVKSNLNKSFDLSSEIVNNVNKKCPNEVFFPENKRKNKNDEQSVMKDNVSENSAELGSFINLKKKKKEEKEVLIHQKTRTGNSSENHNQTEKNEGLDVKEFTSYTSSTEFNVNEKHYSKKKKKKDKRKRENEKNVQQSSNVMGIFAGGDTETLKKIEPIECVDQNSFVKQDEIKERKKERKKKKSEAEKPHAELNKANQCLFSNEAEDEIFYSTQLYPSLPKKMKICCSPILKNTSIEDKYQKLAELNEKETKQKHQKQKRKLELVKGPTESKKLKTSHSCSSESETSKDKMNSDEGVSVVQTMTEEVYKKQVPHESKEELSRSHKERSKEWKKKKEMLNLAENSKSKIEQNVEIDNLLDEVRKQEIERVKEELNISGVESSKEIKKKKSKVKKKEEEKTGENSFSLKKSTKAQNDTHDDEKKLIVQNMMDNLLKEEINRVNDGYNKSDIKRLKKEKKAEKVINKEEETSEKKTHNTLYEKLLKEAKSAMDLEEDKCLILPNAKQSGKKTKKDLSNCTSFVKTKGSMEKKDENSQKTKNWGETPEKYKNGSMYDAAFTPEKVNFEKSLFSDSEQSNTSPTKREKKTANSVAQITSKKVTEAVKNGSGKEKERRSSNSEQEQESLYEKLLSEAKSLIQSSNECSLTKKKEKQLQVPKNKKNDCKTS